jgi:hypothetical protein
MKRTRLHLFIYLIVSAILIIAGSCAFAAATDRKITGYYYDPNSGKVLPKYDDLTPGEVVHYLGLKQCTVQKSDYSSPGLTYTTTSYVNSKGQTLRDEVDYNYSYSQPNYQYNIDYTSENDYYYYSNGNIQSYRGTGTEKGNYSSGSYSYEFNDSYAYIENYRLDGNVSDGSYKYYDQNGQMTSDEIYSYNYYDNGNYQSIHDTSSGYDPATGKKTYTYDYTDSYDINGNWTGYHYVYKDGDGNIIEEYTYP